MNKHSPLVSIIIPCFNSAPWIKDTIKSALTQTWNNIEIIVVNDGSTDDSLNLVKSFNNSNIELLSTENRGASAARNTGFKHSKGNYIQFLDSDDLIHKKKIELQVEALKNNKNSLATCSWERFYNDNISSVSFNYHDDYKDYQDPVEWIIEAWNRKGTMPPLAWLIPRELVVKSGLWNEELSLCDDTEFFTRILLNSEKIIFCGDAKGFYRSGHESLSGRKDIKAYESLFKVCELCTYHVLDFENTERTRKASANLWQNFIFEAYPKCPDLIESAERRIKELGGADIKMPGSPIFKHLSKVIGWRSAKRIRDISYNLGYKKIRNMS